MVVIRLFLVVFDNYWLFLTGFRMNHIPGRTAEKIKAEFTHTGNDQSLSQ